MSFKISAENALLGILMAGPKHGYELHGYMSARMNEFWQLSMSQIYALLKRLEREGFVVSKQEQQENRPVRKTFSLTRTGKERFLAWVESPVRHVRDIRIEFMAKLFFIREIRLRRGDSLIEQQIEVLEKKLKPIEASKEKSADSFEQLLFSFKTAQTAAVLKWLHECRQVLAKRGWD
jgi:PadR family transcriptional regulator, regulatory protein AphA